jgi:hypothetical protein
MTLDEVQIISFEPGLAGVFMRGRAGHSIGRVKRLDDRTWTVLRSVTGGTFGTFRTRRDAVEGLLALLDGRLT